MWQLDFCNPGYQRLFMSGFSLRGRRLEVVGARKTERARGRHARGVLCLPSCVSLSCAHYFQATATQASAVSDFCPKCIKGPTCCEWLRLCPRHRSITPHTRRKPLVPGVDFCLKRKEAKGILLFVTLL